MTIVGIDPGLTGAVGMLCRDRTIKAMMMPLNAKQVDIGKLNEIIRAEIWIQDEQGGGSVRDEMLVVIEEPSPFPTKLTGKDGKQVYGGAVTNFKMGERLGELRALCLLNKWPFILVKPMSWKAKVLHGTDWRGDSKAQAIRYMQSLHPEFEMPSAKYKMEAMADALCIAEYGRQFHLAQTEVF